MPPPETNRELDRRERGRAVPPDPATVFTAAELARLTAFRDAWGDCFRYLEPRPQRLYEALWRTLPLLELDISRRDYCWRKFIRMGREVVL